MKMRQSNGDQTVEGINIILSNIPKGSAFLHQGPVVRSPIDLFSLYVLFSHFRPRDATRGNSFFQMSSYARANVRITNEKKQKANSHEGITWSEMGKQNVQAKEVFQANPGLA